MLCFLDVFFVSFHSALIVFNLTGWIWRRTRRFHLALIAITCLSWFGLGLVYGIGYCPSTDWHWQVKEALGETNLPASYVKYYADRVTGLNWNPLLVDTTVAFLGVSALIASMVVNLRDWRGRNR